MRKVEAETLVGADLEDLQTVAPCEGGDRAKKAPPLGRHECGTVNQEKTQWLDWRGVSE